MQLSLKPTNISDFFVPFQKSASNFKHLEKKDVRHRYLISKITHRERLG